MRNTYDLTTYYDARSSFYGKAKVNDDGKTKTLYSYDTEICRISDGTARIVCRVNQLSNTTMRHLKEFLLQNYFRAENKKQILNDYME